MVDEPLTAGGTVVKHETVRQWTLKVGLLAICVKAKNHLPPKSPSSPSRLPSEFPQTPQKTKA